MATSGDGTGDKFSSLIIPNCLRTASDEVKLQSCSFASGLKLFLNDSQSTSSPENVAGVPIITLPDSSEEYHTPPEDNSNTTDRNDGDQMEIDSGNVNAHQVFDKMPQREGKSINIEKRKLPVSIKTQGQSGQTSNCSKDMAFKDVLSRVMKMAGEVKRGRGNGGDGGDVDILEVAMARGMTFPRPRWWPAEGFK